MSLRHRCGRRGRQVNTGALCVTQSSCVLTRLLFIIADSAALSDALPAPRALRTGLLAGSLGALGVAAARALITLAAAYAVAIDGVDARAIAGVANGRAKLASLIACVLGVDLTLLAGLFAVDIAILAIVQTLDERCSAVRLARRDIRRRCTSCQARRVGGVTITGARCGVCDAVIETAADVLLAFDLCCIELAFGGALADTLNLVADAGARLGVRRDRS